MSEHACARSAKIRTAQHLVRCFRVAHLRIPGKTKLACVGLLSPSSQNRVVLRSVRPNNARCRSHVHVQNPFYPLNWYATIVAQAEPQKTSAEEPRHYEDVHKQTPEAISRGANALRGCPHILLGRSALLPWQTVCTPISKMKRGLIERGFFASCWLSPTIFL